MSHIFFDPTSVVYEDFFQDGGGAYTFEGFPYQRGYGVQYGAGVGNIFRSLLRFLMPYAKEAGKLIKTEGLHTGARILDDVAEGVKLKDALITESKVGLKNITGSAINKMREQKGEGRKRKRRTSVKKRRIVGKSVPAFVVKKRKRVDSLGFY